MNTQVLALRPYCDGSVHPSWVGGDTHWSTGAAFGDYDGDGCVDLMVTDYANLEALSLLKGMVDLTGEPGRH